MSLQLSAASTLILAILASCSRPDSWNGESVRVQSSKGEAYLSVSAYHEKTGGIDCQVCIGLPDDPARRLLYSEIELKVFDQHGRPVAYHQGDPAEEQLGGTGGAGSFSYNAHYALTPTKGQEPTSAKVAWEGKTYTFRKLSWWDPWNTGRLSGRSNQSLQPTASRRTAQFSDD